MNWEATIPTIGNSRATTNQSIRAPISRLLGDEVILPVNLGSIHRLPVVHDFALIYSYSSEVATLAVV